VVAVKVREEYCVNRTGVDATSVHVWEERCTAVKEEASVHHHRTVVSLW
jgi:hypothetical protein